ncbi:hypothetical protein EB796_023734 [Bugula neritina]|uniref:Uncharacterized protein n=1 Tax=Bugula neritina TaxID=10212 RepID=A0A7J7IX42_BUGNE|nr:hypothetical protein EB796_023734 [Bugula neritina]
MFSNILNFSLEMANPGRQFQSYSNEPATFSGQVTRHRKIEGFHTDSRCRYKAPERHGREYILKRDCHCQNFPNDEEVHYSPNCHYTVRQDSGMDNEKVILLLKCACNTENLLARYPNTESSVCILL